MRVIGIGTDIVECARIRRMIERHGELFLARVFTEKEMQYCQARKKATEHFAAFWAAKESVLKAIGLAGRNGVSWTQIEIRHDSEGRPSVALFGSLRDAAAKLKIKQFLVSLSHCRTYATASAIAQTGDV